jgi:hypothetical protein
MALGDGIEVGPLAGNAEAGVVRSAAPRASDVASAIFFIGISVADAGNNAWLYPKFHPVPRQKTTRSIFCEASVAKRGAI